MTESEIFHTVLSTKNNLNFGLFNTQLVNKRKKKGKVRNLSKRRERKRNNVKKILHK